MLEELTAVRRVGQVFNYVDCSKVLGFIILGNQILDLEI